MVTAMTDAQNKIRVPGLTCHTCLQPLDGERLARPTTCGYEHSNECPPPPKRKPIRRRARVRGRNRRCKRCSKHTEAIDGFCRDCQEPDSYDGGWIRVGLVWHPAKKSEAL